jgi:hypothetical protein
MVLMDSTLESLTPSVNAPLKVVLSWMVKNKKMFIMDELLMDNKILCVTHGKNI